jgi:S1-C subfamily serine protease
MSITITHLEGPLAGQKRRFDEKTKTIKFGREADCQIIYPPECTIVGKQHFQLERQSSGDYRVNLEGKRYVNVDGVPADNNTVVSSGSVLRLGSAKDGPSFNVEIEKAKAVLPDTQEQEKVKTWREMLADTRKLGAAGLGALAALLSAAVVYFMIQADSLESQIETAKAEAVELASKSFSPAVLGEAAAAVHLVVKKDGKKLVPMATAWAFAPDKLGTNAHVTEALDGAESSYAIVALPFEPGKDAVIIEIKDVVTHPGYGKFKVYRETLGTARGGKFTALDIISQYDVGIIEIDAATPLPIDPKTGKPAMLELASDDELRALTPGTPVALIGFPSEGLKGADTKATAPPTHQFGWISSLMNVFMGQAEPAQQVLVQHSVPVAGGASGSPLIDRQGKVIGVVTGGNVVRLAKAGGDKTEGATSETQRVPNAALINFAARADLIEALRDGDAEQKLALDEDYWNEASKQFDNYFTAAATAFVDLTRERYGVGDAPKIESLGAGSLDPGNTKSVKFVTSQAFPFKALPGHVYGFIADAESGVPISITVKRQGSEEFVRDKKDPRQVNEPELAPTAWVTEPMELEISVWSLTELPADFELKVYDWQSSRSAADAAP